MLDDATLLRRYADSRDEAAFALLVERHLDRVYAAALRRVANDSHLASDIAQKVFIALAEQASWMSHHPALTAWLYTTVRNQAANAVRSNRRRKNRELEAFVVNESNAISNPELDWKIVGPALDQALDQLNDRERAAVLLRFVEGCAFGEIGRSLQISEDAARMRVDRSLEKLRTALSRRGIISTASVLSGSISLHASAPAPPALAGAVNLAALQTHAALVPSATTFLQLMTTTKIAASVAAAALILLALGTATYEMRANRAADEALTLVTLQRDSARAEYVALESEIGAAQAQLAAANQKKIAEDQAQAKLTAGANADPTSAAAQTTAIDGKAFLLRHSEVKAALTRFNRATQSARWQPFFAAAQLTPAEIERLQTLLSVGSSYMESLQSANQVLKISAAPDLTRDQTDAQIHTLLGPEGYKKYTDYVDTIPARDLTTALAGVLTFSDEPLTPVQSDQLIGVLTTDRQRKGPAENPQIDWAAALDEAKAFLSPAQLTVLGELQAEDNYSHALNRTRASQ